MERWLKESGAVGLNDLELANFQVTGRGVRSLQYHKEGERVLTIPCGILWTVEHAYADPLLGPALRSAQPPLTVEDTLATYILFVRSRKSGYNGLRSHVTALPTSYSSSIFFTENELEVCAGTSLYTITKQLQRQVEEDYAGLVARIFGQYQDLFPLDKFTIEDYKWALSTVWSRGMDFVLPDGNSIRLLAPFADMLNHSSEVKQCHVYDASSGNISVLAGKDYKVGDQVFINYGPLPNTRLLRLYGFVLSSNPNDSYDIVLSTHPTAPFWEQKQKLWISAGLDSTSTISLTLTDPLPKNVLRYLRIQRLDESDLSVIQVDATDGIINESNEVEVLQFLVDSFCDLLANFRTQLETLEEQLAASVHPPGGNAWAAAHVSLGEQWVLRLARKRAEDLLAAAESGRGRRGDLSSLARCANCDKCEFGDLRIRMASIASKASRKDAQRRSSSESSSPHHLSEPSDLEKAATQDNINTNINTNLGSSHASTSGTSGRVSRIQSLARRHTTRSQFDHPLSHVQTGHDVLVDFDGPDDPYRPINWSFRKKIVTTLLYGLTTMGSTWASSVYSPAIQQISEQYHVGTEVSLLGLAVLLCGFGLGPLIWAPLSEAKGRKPAVLVPYFLAAIFSFATAAAKDIQTIIITRFFTGFFGSAPVTNTGGVLGDIWAPTERGTAIVGYAFAVVGGPVLGPIVGGAVTQSYLRWRWTEYLTGIIMMTFLILDVLILDESHPPRLLVFKARRLRFQTGNWALHAAFEEWDVSLKEMAMKFGVRPFQMLLTPICFFVALYASFVYGILYANLAAFPIEFEEERGWNLLVGALPFLALLIGILIGGAANVVNQKHYNRRFAANGNKAVPEARLPPMMIGSFFFAGGLFMFGWTSSKSIHWIAPCVGAALMGFGFFTIFQSALNYLIDTFQKYAASAIAANTFLRSCFAASFPLFVNPMYHKLGIPWASSTFAFFALCLIPIPFVFSMYGKKLRSRGRYSANMG